MIQFLFRKAGAAVTSRDHGWPRIRLGSWVSEGNRRHTKSAEWTQKLASSLDHHIYEQNGSRLEQQEYDLQMSSDLALRLEGPYFSPADPSRYHAVVCLVAGTGISGAIAIAGAFTALRKSRATSGSASSNIPRSGSPWRKCVIAWSVRERDYIDLPCLNQSPGLELRVCQTGPGRPRQDIEKIITQTRDTIGPDAAVWAYISGPKGFIENAKTLCKRMSYVDYYAASWDI